MKRSLVVLAMMLVGFVTGASSASAMKPLPTDVVVVADQAEAQCRAVLPPSVGDRNPNVGDGITILNHLFLGGPSGQPHPPDHSAADEAVTNIADPAFAAQFLVAGVPLPLPEVILIDCLSTDGG